MTAFVRVFVPSFGLNSNELWGGDLFMSLHDKLINIKKSDWCYYDNMTLSDYKDAIQEPLFFIESYFYYAGKNKFLYESLFDFQQTDNPEQIKRAVHTVSTFFLGIYLKEKIDFLKPHNNSFLANDKNFLWAWFLCSLYHDSFFDKNEDVIVNCDYHHFSKGLLYNPDLIQRYYEKCKTKETAYKNEPKFDHGIVAAEKLYSNYTNMIVEELKSMPNTFKDFISNKDLEHCGLRINYSTFSAMCKIAKIIACHNIFVADKKEESKYEKIPELIPGNKKFFYMPNIKNHNTMNSYEKLYFLLALVDTLEPSKRGIDLNHIDIQADKIQHSKYVLRIETLGSIDKQKEYYNGIKQLSNWLNFVEINKDGQEIHIDFHNNKN